MALFDPRSGLSVAVLLNDQQLDYAATREVLALVAAELKLGQLSFLENGFF